MIRALGPDLLEIEAPMTCPDYDTWAGQTVTEHYTPLVNEICQAMNTGDAASLGLGRHRRSDRASPQPRPGRAVEPGTPLACWRAR
jgi:hypothetical protein